MFLSHIDVCLPLCLFLPLSPKLINISLGEDRKEGRKEGGKGKEK